ncbi:hypothetical protein D3C78_1625970 [compost metagenome]
MCQAIRAVYLLMFNLWRTTAWWIALDQCDKAIFGLLMVFGVQARTCCRMMFHPCVQAFVQQDGTSIAKACSSRKMCDLSIMTIEIVVSMVLRKLSGAKTATRV